MSKWELLCAGAESTSGDSSSGSSGSGLSDGESAVKGNSVPLTAALIVADVVGAGILSMPVAVAQCGWLLGAAGVLGFLAMNVHISLLMWRVKMMHPHVTTYRELAAASFSRAPEWQRRAAVVVSFVTQQTQIFACLALYVLASGRGIGMMLFETRVCLPHWVLVAVAVMLPFLTAARKMGTMCALVWLNILSLVGSIAIPLAYIVALNDPHASVEAVRPLDLAGVMTASSIFCFAFTGQVMLVEIMSEMENPADLPTAYLWVAGPFQAFAFLVTGVIGYCYIGDTVDDMIVRYLPFGVLFRAAALCLTVHMLISYLIKNVVLCREIHKRVDGAHADETTPRSYVGWFLVVVGVAASAYTFANVVPFFTDAVGLIGSLTCPINCLILPTLAYIRAYADSERGTPRLGAGEKLALAFELGLSAVIVVYGTYTACVRIGRNWDTYGYPFDCHCEGMWNTCECSADNFGAGQCPASPE